MKLTWDDIGSRFYKVGIDKGVLYPMADENYQNGVAWSGLTGVDYSPAGREKTVLYTGDVKKRLLFSPEEYGGTIKAYFYPDAFENCIGNAVIADGMILGQQESIPFGLSYRTYIGNDVVGNKHAYQLHVLYESHVTSIKDTDSTVNESLSPTEFNWGFECIPVDFGEYSPVSHIAIDSRKFSEQVMTTLEEALWGTEDTEPRLLLPQEIYDIILGDTPDSGLYPASDLYLALDLYPAP